MPRSLPLLAALILFSNLQAADAPRLHGPTYDGQSRETGLLKSWPEGGPELLWTAEGLGRGYATPVVGNGLCFVVGTNKEQEASLTALKPDGTHAWRAPVGYGLGAKHKISWVRKYHGSHGTPTLSDGILYVMDSKGLVTALSAVDGAIKWQVDLGPSHKPKLIHWGLAQAPLVINNRVHLMIGGEQASVTSEAPVFAIALDAATGETVWECTAIKDPVSYASLVAMTIHGVEQLVSHHENGFFALNMDGSLLWEVRRDKRPAKWHGAGVPPILYKDDILLVPFGDKYVTEAFRVTGGEEWKLESMWVHPEADPFCGGVIVHDGAMYGAGDRDKTLYCVDIEIGKELWRKKPFKDSGLVMAEGLIYAYEVYGTMRLIRPSREGLEVISQFKIPSAGKSDDCWAHPVISDGRLYLRHHGKVYLYDVLAEPSDE